MSFLLAIFSSDGSSPPNLRRASASLRLSPPSSASSPLTSPSPMAFFILKTCTPRPLFSVFFCATTLLFALACYILLLSSASIATIAAFFLPQIPPERIIFTNCTVGDDRGSQLFHSWSDAELFERALSAEAKGSSEAGSTGLPLPASSSEGLRGSLLPIARQGKGRLSRRTSSQKQTSCHHQRLPNVNYKIAFMFLTTGPLPFAPLWNQFFHGHEHLYNIYVHLDPFRVDVFDRETAGVFWGRLIPPGRTERGTPSLVAAARRLLANALLDDPLNHFFAVLSERCIPLVGFHNVYDHVMASDKSFLEILRDAPTLKRRYEARGPGKSVMLPEVPFKSFRVGSQFSVLTRKHAVIVVSDERIWSKFKIPCVNRGACYAEEHYFPTLIDMVDGACATRSTLTNVDWARSPGNGHPHTYNKREVGQKLITSLRRNNTFLFARKFGDDCLEPLLKLSSLILGEKHAKI